MDTIADRIAEALGDKFPAKGPERYARGAIARLAEAVGLEWPSVAAWITGDTRGGIKPQHLHKAAKFLDVRMEWLAVGELPKKRKETSLSQDEWELVALYKKLEPRYKKNVKNLAEDLLLSQVPEATEVT